MKKSAKKKTTKKVAKKKPRVLPKRVSKNKPKTNKFIPSYAYDMADQDYLKDIPKDMADLWITQFNAEYYSNDHSKKDSLFRKNLKGYDTKLTMINDKGQPTTMSKFLFGLTNQRSRCEAPKDGVLQEEVDNSPTINDKIEDALTLMSPKQILDALRQEAITDITYDIKEISNILDVLIQYVMVLTLVSTKKAKKTKA